MRFCLAIVSCNFLCAAPQPVLAGMAGVVLSLPPTKVLMVMYRLLGAVRLRSLSAVVEHGSFTAASAALGYSISAVSLHVSSLEKEAGVALLQKSAAGYSLTAPGVRLCEFGRWISLAQQDFLKDFFESRP